MALTTSDRAPSTDADIVNWVARRLCETHIGEPVTDADWDTPSIRATWTPVAAGVLRVFDSPGSPVRMIAAKSPAEPDVITAYARVTEHPAETLNAVVDAITKGAGWLPLSVRYGTAVLAIEATQQT